MSEEQGEQKQGVPLVKKILRWGVVVLVFSVFAVGVRLVFMEQGDEVLYEPLQFDDFEVDEGEKSTSFPSGQKDDSAPVGGEGPVLKDSDVADVHFVDARRTYQQNEWVIDTNSSTLSFEATQYGQKFNGNFDFDGKIIFDPQDLANSTASITIDIASISTGSLERDARARSDEWFNTARYPVATYNVLAFTQGEGDDMYVAHGVLSLHGVDLPVDLPFSLRFSDDKAQNLFMNEVGEEVLQDVGVNAEPKKELDGSDIGGGNQDTVLESEENEMAKTKAEMLAQIDISRSDFGVGTGRWGKSDAVGDKVGVYIVLHARKPEALR